MSQTDVEFDIIGVALTSQNGCLEKALTLDEDDFSTAEISLIFRVMRNLHAKGESLEFLKIASGLKGFCDNSEKLDACLDYLAKIPTQKNYFESRINTFDGMIESIRKRGFDITRALRLGAELQSLKISTSYLVDGLLPQQSITLFSARGGAGKTILSIGMADAVSKGVPFLGLNTVKTHAIYVDFENSLPTLVSRINRIDASQVLFWHTSNEIRPPRLDSSDYKLYKKLPAGSLLIFDTLRASQGSDENDSKQMAFIMQRLKEFRDCGFTILLLHHTNKLNDKQYKGSTAIYDLSDHVLSLYRVKNGNFQESDDGNDYGGSGDYCYRFGTQDKTRYEPFETFVQFDVTKGFFVPAKDPETETLEIIYDLLKGKGSLNQSQATEIIKTGLGMRSVGKIITLLKRGVGQYWKVLQTGSKNSTIYTLLE